MSMASLPPQHTQLDSILASSVRLGISQRNDFPLNSSKTALLIIDVQDYLSTRTPSMLMRDGEDYLHDTSLPNAIPNIEKLVRTMRTLRDDKKGQSSVAAGGCEVIFTFLQAQTTDCRDVSLDYKLSGPKLASLPNPTTPATFKLLPPTLHPNSAIGDILLPKTSCSVFLSTNINYILKNLHIEQLLVCGQLTDQCVQSAVRDAADMGYFVSVVEDACAALSHDDHVRGLDGMRGFSRMITTDLALQELLKQVGATVEGVGTLEKAGHDEIISSTSTAPRPPQLTLKPVTSWEMKSDREIDGLSKALLSTLEVAGVKFIRYAALDIVNSIRTKAVPLNSIKKNSSSSSKTVLQQHVVSIAKVCMGGAPSFADTILPGTNLSSKDVLTIKPDWSTLRILPYTNTSSMVLGTVHDQRTGVLSEFCARGLLDRLLQTAKESLGLGFTVGTEIEFCLFERGSGNKYGVGDDGFIPVDKTLFASPTTLNDQEDFINDLSTALDMQNIPIQMIHAESASGQLEVVMSHSTNVMQLADNIIFAKETIKEIAKKHNKRSIFLPKNNTNEAGCGMHVHLSLRDETSSDPDINIFPGTQIGTISSVGESFLEGILCHLPGLTALTMPTVNSYLRVAPGCWTGHDIRWGIEEKECPLRVCLDVDSGIASNVEFKLLDATSNIYLSLASILRAGIDGVAKNLKLRKQQSPGCDQKNFLLPTSLDESLDCLLSDDVLMDLLGIQMSTSYIAVKKAESQHFGRMTLAEQVDDALRRGV